ncbi:UNVERIFIED_CONTAM: hypothetical protein Sangu_2766200 [Sesamum angustifolium]|uniref:Integrase catalytic domain-containing protein n=1 Tax=Sesamum angustifolium TaxID=2727405 RepID=A0AAW2IVM5_9LAMI
MPVESELSDDLPDKDVLVIEVMPPWKMYFDRASNKEGVGAGVMLVTSEGEVLPYSFTLTKNCSNNVAEYPALFLRLKIDVDVKELPLKVYRDSQPVNSPPTLIYEPPEPLHPTVDSWPFDAWGLGVVGPLTKSSGGHLYILAITDYFSIWAKAVVPLKEVKKENVADFIRTHIIYPYGVLRHIIIDNGKPFYNSLIDKLCQKFGFKQRNSSIYYAIVNGIAKAFNKTLCNLLKKVVAKSKRDWYEGLEKLYGHIGPLLEHLLKQLRTH